MAYRFETGETVEQGFRRVATEQLDRAVSELTEGMQSDPVRAVHEARKALKMERSLLRLCRDALKSSMRRHENHALRAAAARLSGARDADVMLEALEGLSQRYVGQVPADTFSAIRAQLEHERDNLRMGLQLSGVSEAAVEELRASRERLATVALRRRGWDALEGGLTRSYTRGRRAMGRAERHPTAENLHEWRKRVKDLWYHLRLLEPAAPLTMAGHAGEAHALADLLGDDHDFAVLRQTVLGLGSETPVDHDAVVALIDHRREQLEQEAHFLGARLYAERPKAFRRRLRRYWSASRAEARALSARDAAAASDAATRPHRV
jgi:CHAD domain-containing protein